MNEEPTLVRLRATIVPYDAESAAMSIQLPATLYTLRFPNEVEVNLQTYWTNITNSSEIRLRFIGNDGTPWRADTQLALQREGREWRAACIEAIQFSEQGLVSLVLEHEGREIERFRLEMKPGAEHPYRP